MTQYFFMDESGDPGAFNPASSPYYVITLVQLPSREAIPEFQKLRQTLHLPDFEFHFYRMSQSQKDAFFQAIHPVLFRVRTAVLVKTKATSLALTGVELTIDMATRLILRSSPLDIGDDILVMDGATDSLRKSLRMSLSKECAYTLRPRPFKKLVAANSAHEDGLQLADMLAGAIREFSWKNDKAFYNHFSEKVVDFWQVK